MKWLSSSLLLARFGGMEIRFHVSMLFSIPAAYYLFRPSGIREFVVAFSWLLGFVLCILLHELGHALTARLFGVEVKSVVIWLLGGFTSLIRKVDQPSHTLAISAAGPLVNMFLAFLCVVCYAAFYFTFLFADKNTELLLWANAFSNLFFSLALLNFVLIVFNLLPVYPLDGGNILHSVIEMFFGRPNADLVTLIIGVPVLLCLFAFGYVIHDYLLIFSCILIAMALGTLNHSFQRFINLGFSYFFRRGGYYYLQGDYERAIQHYTLYVEKEPRQSTHYVARAACFLNIMQKDRAEADVERALNLDPGSLLALQLRGEIYMLEKNYDHAMEFFDRALLINPNWAVPYFDRGSVLLDKKEYQSALVEINKAISFMPQFHFFYLIRSVVHFKLGDMESAHQDEDHAVHLSEKEALVMTDLNMSAYENRLDWAEHYYMYILSKKPRLAYAYQGRADARRVNNEHDRAIADYTHALDLMPREPRIYIGRGKSYQAINETKKAETDFQSAFMLADKPHLKYQAEDLLKKIHGDIYIAPALS